MDPAIRSKTDLILLPLPFAIMAGAFSAFVAVGPGWGFLPLPVVGPAVAAAIGGVWYTLAAGAMAMAECLLLAISMPADRRPAEVAFLAAAGVTTAGVLACRSRERRDRELAQVTVVAEAAQQVLLRPVPDQVGPVRLAVRYLSASTGARIGGDLYEVIGGQDRVRLIVGDVEGKGLPAIKAAAVVLGVFREAAYEENSLAEIVARIETSLAREPGSEQFVTAVLAEIPADLGKMQLLSCGHPAPLLLGTSRPRFVGPEDGGLPLGLGDLAAGPRVPVTIPFLPGDGVLFYTDGASEARNKAGEFFPLADCGAVTAPRDPGTLVDRLSEEVVRHVGHAPDDDIALLLAYRDAA